LRRHRKKLIIAGSVAGAVLLSILFVGPAIAASIIRGKIAAAVAENLDATAEIGSVSFSWGGRIRIDDLVIRDRSGASVGSVESIEADVSLGSALRGRYIADVRIDAPRLSLRRAPDGRLNVQTLPKPAKEPAPPAPAAPHIKGPLPFVQAKVRVTGGVLAVEGETALWNGTATVTVDSLDKPIRFEASANHLRASGEFALPDSKGAVKIDIESLPIAPLAPVADLKSLEGRVDGSLEYRMASAKEIAGGGNLRISSLAVNSAKVPDVLIVQSFQDHPIVRIEAGDALLVELRGNLPFEGTFGVISNLGPLSDLAAQFIAIRKGQRLEGTASARGTFSTGSGIAIRIDEAVAKIKGAELRASGRIEGPSIAIKVESDLAPDDLKALLDLPLAGPRITVRAEVTEKSVKGLITAPMLRIADFEQSNLKAEFEVAPSQPGFELRSFEIRTDTLTATAKGHLRGGLADSSVGASVTLGNLTRGGLTASGKLDLKLEGGRASAEGRLDVNEGNIAVRVDADLRPAQEKQASSSRIDLAFEKVRANAQMGRFLELLHPVFAVAGDGGGKVDGRIDAALNLTYSSALTAEMLSGKLDNLRTDRLNGGGRFELRDAEVRGSELLGQLFGSLAGDRREIRMRPVEFRIDAGRIVYDKPWQWTVSGSETTFTGSVGIDRTLDLMWHIPVTDELASRVPALKASRGKTIDAPIKGSVWHPRLGWKEVVGQAVEDKLEKGIEGLLGGRDEKKAQKLLEEADALYGEGRKAEAAEKYRRIKDDLDRTRVYKENRDRIRQRMNEK
jgi:hypothetical protein